jgi:hypothetical protein
MDKNEWERRKYEPDICPIIEARLQSIKRDLEKNDISYRELSEELNGDLTESEISEYLDRKIHMSYFWVGALIIETSADIIERRHIQSLKKSQQLKNNK